MNTKQKITVEIQYFEGCPNTPELMKRTRAVLQNYKDQVEYREILVDSPAKAQATQFRGSPTLLINGEDFENTPAPEQPALACRYYANGLPSSNEIRKKLKQYLDS
jgi:hypothetical protein